VPCPPLGASCLAEALPTLFAANACRRRRGRGADLPGRPRRSWPVRQRCAGRAARVRACALSCSQGASAACRLDFALGLTPCLDLAHRRSGLSDVMVIELVATTESAAAAAIAAEREAARAAEEAQQLGRVGAAASAARGHVINAGLVRDRALQLEAGPPKKRGKAAAAAAAAATALAPASPIFAPAAAAIAPPPFPPMAPSGPAGAIRLGRLSDPLNSRTPKPAFLASVGPFGAARRGPAAAADQKNAQG